MHSEHLYPLMQDVRFRVYRRKAYLSAASKKKTYPNIDFVDLPSSRIKGVEALLHTLLCVLHIAFHRPDAVHVHNMGPGMFIPVLKLLRLPVVMTYHSVNYEHAKWNGWQRRLLRWCEKLSLRYSDRIIFVNQFQMEKYDEQVRSKSVYIPNGIDTVTRSQSTSFLEARGIRPGKYLLGVGRLTPEKGFEYLIEAAGALPQVEQVVIAGGSDHDTAYFEKLKSLDTGHKVVFTGFTSGEDLRQLYSHARLFVLPSLNEGFGLCMPEAMFNGCLAIGHNTTGTKEQLDNGVEQRGAEIALRYDTLEQLTQCLADVGGHPASHFAPYVERAFLTVNQLYTIEQNAERVFRFYQDIVGAKE